MSGNPLNEALKDNLKRLALSDHVAQAYLLSGEDASESLRIAEEFARLLTDSPADILYFEHEKPNLISVDDVRVGINQSVYIKPYAGGHKVYIVQDAELMNVQAQNALLKTLEEPPAYVVILLLASNAEAFLPTILSRCVKLSVSQESGDVLSSEDLQAVYDLVRELMRDAVTLDTKKMLEYIDRLGKYKLFAKDALERIRAWMRDVLIYKAGKDTEVLLFPRDAAIIRQFAERVPYTGITKITDALNDAAHRLDANVNYELTWELLLMTVRDALNVS